MKKCWTVSLLLLLAGLSFAGVTDKAVGWLGGRTLYRANEAYLSSAFSKALASFVTVSALKAGLDIIEGSTVSAGVGISAQVEAGDAISPVYDYVDVTWRVLLASCVVLLSTQYLLSTAITLGGWMLGLTALLFLCRHAVRWWRPAWGDTQAILRDLAGMGVILTIVLYGLLPLSVFGASRLSLTITQPVVAEAQGEFLRAENRLSPEKQEAMGFFARIRAAANRVEHVTSYLKDRGGPLITSAVRTITGYLFDVLLFPVGVFLLLFWLTRLALRAVWRRNIETTFREDVLRLLGELRPPRPTGSKDTQPQP